MLSFSNAVGNFYNLIGKLGGIAKKLRTYQNDIKSLMTDTTSGVVAQTKNEPDVQAIMGDSYISILSGTGGSVTGTLQNLAAAYLNRLVYRDSPRLNQTLDSSNVNASVGELIRQMKVAGATVLAQTVSATATSFTGTGNGVLVASVKRPVDGAVLENASAETLTVVCTTDSYISGATAGSETLTVAGTGSQGDPFAFDWPLGSNATATLSVIDGNQDNASGNLLTNSGFEKFTSNVPDNWTLSVGVAGTNVIEEDSIVYDPTLGGKALRVKGDAGGTLTELDQTFNVSTGTSGTLDALTQYSVCLFARRDGVASSAGTLSVSLIDGSGNVINDMAGVPNTFTVDLTSLGTNYASYTGVFRTPLMMPATTSLRVRTSAPYDSGRSFYLDKFSMGEMTQLYASGPYVNCHGGSALFITGDYASLTITNSMTSNLNSFQPLLSRLFPVVLSSEVLFPSSATPTVSDTDLIQ